MKKSRIFSLILAILMVAALFAGCGKKEETTTAEPTVTTTTTAETTTTPEPKLNFDGYTFTFVEAGYSNVSALWYETPSSVGQQEIMDALFEIEGEYNCKITNISSPGNDALAAAFLAGTKVGDFIYVEDDAYGNNVIQGFVRRLDTDEVRAVGMDVFNPDQFDVISVTAGLIGGEAYCIRITNETLPAQLGRFYCFNKALVASAGYPSETIYQAVREGTWTWDVLIDICRAGTVFNAETGLYDIDGISRVFTNSELKTMCNGIVYFNGQKYVSGIGEVATMSALNTVVNRLIMDPGVMYTNMDKGVGNNYGNSASRQRFYDGKAIFGTFDCLTDPYPECNFAYGVIPMPRGGIKNDYTCLMSYYQAYICQVANPDWEKACAIMGLIGTALNKSEDSTKAFETMTYDADSIDMLANYIFPSVEMDISGFCAPAWDIFWQQIRAGIRAGQTAAAVVDANKAAFNLAIEEYWTPVNNRLASK